MRLHASAPLLSLALLACSSSPSGQTAPAQHPSAATGASSSWSLTTDVGADRCELTRVDQAMRWTCGDGVQHEAMGDARAVAQRVEAIDWQAESTRKEPEQVGPSKRTFRLRRGDAVIELLRYPDPTTPFGALGSAFDRWISQERSLLGEARPAPAPRRDPLQAFPTVTDRGLVTIQQIALPGGEPQLTIRMDSQGEWAASLAGDRRGRITSEELREVVSLVDEASSMPVVVMKQDPCEALPNRGTQVLLGKDRAVAWKEPCASEPPEAFVVLARYLQQVAEGRPAQERAQVLRQRRGR